ncbi:MAG: nucleoside recognition domain-containing protein, partial [Candidatus Ventricola sp.]|nr:nucleoside recognition domain-containing protein [Candidatus Ventricola sp.]
DADNSILGRVGGAIAPIFHPLGFADWRPTVATITGLVAKEEVVNVFGIVYGTDTDEEATADIVDEGDAERMEETLTPIAAAFDETSGGYGQLAAYAFMIFNLLCAPCFAAIGAIKREMNSAKWTWFAIGYQCGFAYVIALIVYQLGRMFSGAGVTVWSFIALALLVGLIYMLVRRNRYDDNHLTQKV